MINEEDFDSYEELFWLKAERIVQEFDVQNHFRQHEDLIRIIEMYKAKLAEARTEIAVLRGEIKS